MTEPAEKAGEQGALIAFHAYFRDRSEMLFERFGMEAIDLYNAAAGFASEAPAEAGSARPAPTEREQYRLDLYSELAEALGSDCMDSHKGRLDRARRANAALKTVSARPASPEPAEKAGEQGAREQLFDLFDEYADATLDHIDWKRVAEISGRIVAALASEAPAEAPAERTKALAEDIRDGGYKDGYAAGLAAAAEAGICPTCSRRIPPDESHEPLSQEVDPREGRCFTESMEALRFLAKRFRHAGVSEAVAEDYARDLEAILAAEAGSAPLAENAPWIPGLGFPPPGSGSAPLVLPDPWISVEERLPDIGVNVLCATRPRPDLDDKPATVKALARFIPYEGASQFWWDNHYPGKGNMHIAEAITHWKPLPPAPGAAPLSPKQESR